MQERSSNLKSRYIYIPTFFFTTTHVTPSNNQSSTSRLEAKLGPKSGTTLSQVTSIFLSQLTSVSRPKPRLKAKLGPESKPLSTSPAVSRAARASTTLPILLRIDTQLGTQAGDVFTFIASSYTTSSSNRPYFHLTCTALCSSVPRMAADFGAMRNKNHFTPQETPTSPIATTAETDLTVPSSIDTLLPYLGLTEESKSQFYGLVANPIFVRALSILHIDFTTETINEGEGDHCRQTSSTMHWHISTTTSTLETT